MEEGEMEMTKKELQWWIRSNVRKNKLIVALTEKRNLLRSLWKRRESRANRIQELSRLLASCEALVKRHYSLLGWDYQNTCSDDDMGTTETESPSTHEPGDSPNLCTVNEETFHINLNRRPVVVLVRLSPRLVSSLRLPLAKSPLTENEDCNNFKGDSCWEPDSEEESNSVLSITNDDTHPNKRRKITNDTEQEDCTTDHACQEQDQSSKNTSTDFDEANTKTLAESKLSDVQDPPSNPDTKVCVNMAVLARNESHIWQKGKVIKIVRNASGAQMYRVCFEDGLKNLVSGHCMAFGNSPQLDQLFVGSRVVVEREDQEPRFCSGILAEVPTMKNKQRYLVFSDDHTPAYVTFSSIHCLCEPSKSPLDNICDEMHRTFMQEYLDKWPYIPKVQYSVGQNLFATCNGTLQSCEVLITDSSLIRVVFQSTEQKEWIYRGSPRLEPIQRNKMVSKCTSQNSF